MPGWRYPHWIWTCFAQSNAFTFWINQHAPELSDEKLPSLVFTRNTNVRNSDAKTAISCINEETPVSTEQLNQLIQRTYQVTEEKADQMMKSSSKPSDYQTQVADRFNAGCSRNSACYAIFIILPNPVTIFKYHILLTGTAAQQAGLARKHSLSN